MQQSIGIIGKAHLEGSLYELEFKIRATIGKTSVAPRKRQLIQRGGAEIPEILEEREI